MSRDGDLSWWKLSMKILFGVMYSYYSDYNDYLKSNMQSYRFMISSPRSRNTSPIAADIDVSSAESRASWARLFRKIYEGFAPIRRTARSIRWFVKNSDLR